LLPAALDEGVEVCRREPDAGAVFAATKVDVGEHPVAHVPAQVLLGDPQPLGRVLGLDERGHRGLGSRGTARETIIVSPSTSCQTRPEGGGTSNRRPSGPTSFTANAPVFDILKDTLPLRSK
jgi:hypothetical protein